MRRGPSGEKMITCDQRSDRNDEEISVFPERKSKNGAGAPGNMDRLRQSMQKELKKGGKGRAHTQTPGEVGGRGV